MKSDADQSTCYQEPTSTVTAPGQGGTGQRDLPPITTFPHDAILEAVHVARALNVSVEKVRGLDLPYFIVGRRERYLWRQVLDVLAERAMPTPRSTSSHRRR